MEWVDKMDLVLEKLYTKSDQNPTMEKLEGWLAKEKIDIGEIQDITLHLYRLKYIYCEVNRNRDSPYDDNGRFPISCEGKLFWENEKGFRVYFQKRANEDAAKVLTDLRMVRWTRNLTWTTIGAACLIVGWEMVKFYYYEGHSFCH